MHDGNKVAGRGGEERKRGESQEDENIAQCGTPDAQTVQTPTDRERYNGDTYELSEAKRQAHNVEEETST